MKMPLNITHPELVLEWHPKNIFKPQDLTAGSNRKIWWQCINRHEWQSAVYSRTLQNRGCKQCYVQRLCGASNPAWRGYGELKGEYWSDLKEGALERNLIFEINIKYAWELFLQQDRRCHFTGEVLSMGGKNLEKTASLDRIDSSVGYIEGNVQWVHKLINMMKRDMSDHEFRHWCEKVHSFNSLSA